MTGGQLFPHLSGSVDDVLVRGQFRQTARSASVEFVGANADFGSQTEFETVVEARAGVDHHGSRVHLGNESLGYWEIVGDDRIRMLRAKAVYMRDRLLNCVYHFRGNNQLQKLGCVIFF